MRRHVILVIVLGRVEGGQLFDRRGDRRIEGLRVVELLDVRLGDGFLIVIFVEDDGSILPAAIGALAVDGRWGRSR